VEFQSATGGHPGLSGGELVVRPEPSTATYSFSPLELQGPSRDDGPTMKSNEGQTWLALAACTSFPTDLFFPAPGEDSSAAIELCDRCLVRRACFNYAMANPELYGVWGGTSSDERALLRRSAG
jgi:WhiB family transcriptional regulator, redox-sensing transcriptional regulator